MNSTAKQKVLRQHLHNRCPCRQPACVRRAGHGNPNHGLRTGKAYRRACESATHLSAFHQLELFVLDERRSLDAWWLAGRILQAIDRVLPRAEVMLA